MTFKWSHIIHQHLKSTAQEIKKGKELIGESNEQKHLYYQSIHQQGYSDGHASGRCWKQYKPVDISQMFKPHYQPTPKKPLPSFYTRKDVLEIHVPIFDP